MSVHVCDLVPGREERGECSMPEKLCGQLVRLNIGLVLQEEALAGELADRSLALFVVLDFRFHSDVCCLMCPSPGCLWSL